MKLFFSLVLIGIIALVLRTISLTEIPAGFSESEASIGYNAYSLLKTGKDENGTFLPLFFNQFGAITSPLPIYLTAPFVAIGGLNEFSIRIVSALLGSLTVLGLFLFVKKYLQNESDASFVRFRSQNDFIALLSSFLLAVSPWHIQLSRFDLQNTLFLFLYILFLFIFCLKGKGSLFILLTLQVLLLLTHPAAIVLSLPLSVYFLIKNIPQKLLRGQFMGVVVGIIILQWEPIKYFYFHNPFFEDTGFLNHINAVRGIISQTLPQPIILIFENKYLFWVEEIIKNYLKNYDLYYLFSQTNIQEPYFVSAFGKLHSIELLFFVVGLGIFIKKFEKRLLLILIILAGLPSLFKTHFFISQSFVVYLIPFYILTAVGVNSIFKQIPLVWLKGSLGGLFLFFWIGSSIAFFHYYFVHFPHVSEVSVKDYYQQVSLKANELKNQYSKVVVFDSVSTNPYIYYLFYNQIDPETYHHELSLNKNAKNKFETIEFNAITFHSDQNYMNQALIGSPKELKPFSDICVDSLQCKVKNESILDTKGELVFQVKEFKLND